MPDTNDPTNTNDIDALLRYLKSGHTPHWYDDSTRWHAALTALVAERNALRDRVDALPKRVAVLESQEFTLPSDPFRDADRNRRDDLVCSLFPILLAAAWSRQTASTTAAEMAETHAAMRELALVEADAMIAAMRKGGARGK